MGILELRAIEEFVLQGKQNYISADRALSAEAMGMQIFEAPILGVAAASDPMFFRLMEPQAIGEHFKLPDEWLPGAKSVISFFLPFSEKVKKSNERDRRVPSDEWLHARIEGQEFLTEVCYFLKQRLEAQGEQALIPALDPRFWSVETPGGNPRVENKKLGYSSNWSERHVAYVCGLGTFGLSKGLITQKGICGRFGSVITTAKLPVTRREYQGLYDYCTNCGACAARCPVEAISLETGKNHTICAAYVDETKRCYAPRYGCGKCQVGVPCMSCAPGKIRDTP